MSGGGGGFSRPPFHRDKPSFRPPPTWQQHRRLRPGPPAPWPHPGFTLFLLRPQRGGTSAAFVESLLAACPARPDWSSTHPADSGPAAARLIFRRWCDALDALAFFWARRLAGARQLTPRLVSVLSDRTEEAARLRPLFAEHARVLLVGDAVRRCERGLDQLADEIAKVSELLARPNRLKACAELQEKRRRLVAEKELVNNRLEEFRAGIRCVLAMLGELGEEEDKEEEHGVEVFRFGKELDWGRIHRVMMRECRRLEEGLPIYGSRRKILKTVVDNQVMVLIGETGSGKSTQLVQYLADSGLAAAGSIVCTQPRKVAAMSLARRVGEESNGCYADNFVTSYTTYSSSKGFTSKVIFMTDHCLLQHCMNDISMAGVSYVIVDEAHERSLNTDLLLALIKKMLLERFDLRLIIMSATADASKLSDYFYGCCTLHVMGRTFPVDIKYVPDVTAEPLSTSSNVKCNAGDCAPYVSDVLKMVSVIHRTEKDGAILAFLTSQMEVEWACDNFDDLSAVLLPMHGKLSCEEQNRVFQNYPGKRKIIFSTNVAETSLTIPGVKYVVDSGMVKDSKFEAGTGMNVLRVDRISQSSANQRAGRAGRTEAGKCYRLYSECVFQSLKMHQEPEIRKVHLGIAVLRILALGIKNVQDFEFVDAPSPKAIETALQNLIHLGAIVCCNDGYGLTDIGCHLVKLGIEPRLGKIILECFSCGLRKEGLVLAAVMANASSIFCRVGSEEKKYKADCYRVPFCHHDGDLFTLLSVYKEWENKHENKNKWCWENSINAKSMRRCQETILELENCLRHELNIIIPSYWLWNPHEPSAHDKLLKKVILSSLPENVAMYSGYDRLGYEVTLTGQQLQLHPSCSLLVYSQKPNWVVFGEILSISNQYLVCVTAVDYECLCRIQPPLFDISQLESRKMQMNVITGVGNTVLRRFCGKTSCNLQSIVSRIQKVCGDSRIGIDVDFDKREIQYFAPPKDMEMVSCIVNDVIQCEAKWLRDECIEKCLFRGQTISSPCMALFGSGAEIKHLELEKRYLTVEISHPHALSLDDKELLMVLDHQVPGIAHFYRHSGSIQEEADVDRWGKITYLSPEAAEIALDKLNKVEFHGSLLKVVPSSAGDHKMLPFPAVRAKVCWPRRPSRGVALVSCLKEDADHIVQDCYQLEIGGRYVNCEVSTKCINCIFVTGIPKDVAEPQLYDAFQSVTKRKILDIHILRGEAINNISRAACADMLVREITPFMPNKHVPSHNFQVEVFNPEPKDYMMKAMITFDGSLHLEAAKALDHIQGKMLPGFLSWQRIQCQHMFHSSVSCSGRVFSVIRKQLDSLLGSFKHRKGVLCKLEKNDNGSFSVKIRANATKTVADLRKPLEKLMKGKTVSHPSLTPAVLQLLLSRDGIALMKALEHETGTYILYDKQRLNVKLFGSPNEVARAEKKLIQSLFSLHENKQLEIHLRGHSLPPDLMKEVVQRFGPDLLGLKEKVPGVEVALNTRRHILSIRGGKELKQKVERVIAEVVQSLDKTEAAGQLSEDASCPICLCDLEEPYKLEACGHDFCRACLIDQCETATRSRDGFPLCCTKAGCNGPLLLVDLRTLLSGEKLEELFWASLRAFVAASGGTYRFCPTPDCPAVYRVAHPREDLEKASPFVCDACGTETCTKCHLEYHPFISCEKYKEFKEDPDQSLVEWRKGKGHVKDCPCCSHTIEKVEGCNHIECRCGAHVCWVCLDWFSSSDECYSHLRSLHSAVL